MAGPLSPAMSSHQSSRPPDGGLIFRDFGQVEVTATFSATRIDVGAARHPWELIIDVSAISGTPTLDVDVTMSDDLGGTNEVVVNSSTTITEPGRYAIPFSSSAIGHSDVQAGSEQLIRQFLGATFTVAGGTPGFTFSAIVVPRNHP